MNTIKFEYIGDYAYSVCEKPYPASQSIPQWFRDHPAYAISNKNPSGKKIIIENRQSNATAKKCTPMLDGMTSGYIIPLWADVQITQKKDGPEISWMTTRDVFGLHGNYSSDKIKPIDGFYELVLKYITYFRIRTPKGYSSIIRNPAGHYDIPFYALPAVIDTDKSVIDSNIPCWVSKSFEGIVEKGTPIAQVIPFKRENWNHDFEVINEDKFNAETDKYFNSTIVNSYIKNLWTKKVYK